MSDANLNIAQLQDELRRVKDQRDELAGVIRDVRELLSRQHKMQSDEFVTSLSGIITAVWHTTAMKESV